jgi:hypothetical protein
MEEFQLARDGSRHSITYEKDHETSRTRVLLDVDERTNVERGGAWYQIVEDSTTKERMAQIVDVEIRDHCNRNKGLGSELMKRTLNHIKNVEHIDTVVSLVVAQCPAETEANQKFMTKFGFQYKNAMTRRGRNPWWSFMYHKYFQWNRRNEMIAFL